MDRLSGSGLEKALDRVQTELLAGRSAESALVALECGRAEAARVAAEHATNTLLDFQRANGSWDDSVGETARALLQLAPLEREFRTGAGRAACAALGYLGTRRNQRGRAFGSCVPGAHELGLCPHFLTGLYAPGDGDSDPAQLPGGAMAIGAEDTAFAVSAAALRAALVWGLQGTDAVLQIEGIRRIVSLWAHDQVDHLLGASAAAEGILVLLFAPVEPATVQVIAEALARIVRSQRADATWNRVEPVHFTEVLLAASTRGYRVEESDRAIARAAALLSSGVHEGYRTADLGAARMFTIWRALRYVLTPPAERQAELTA